MPHMTYYPHHPDGIGAHFWDPEALPDRLLSAEGVLRQNVINHYDELFANVIVVIEESALAQRDSHDLQIIRAYARCQRHRPLILWWHIRGGPVVQLIVAFAHRDGIDRGNGLHPRYAACAIQDILPGRAYLLWVCKRTRRKCHPGDQYVPKVHARIQG